MTHRILGTHQPPPPPRAMGTPRKPQRDRGTLLGCGPSCWGWGAPHSSSHSPAGVFSPNPQPEQPSGRKSHKGKSQPECFVLRKQTAACADHQASLQPPRAPCPSPPSGFPGVGAALGGRDRGRAGRGGRAAVAAGLGAVRALRFLPLGTHGGGPGPRPA